MLKNNKIFIMMLFTIFIMGCSKDKESDYQYGIKEKNNMIFTGEYFEGAMTMKQPNRVLETKEEIQKVCDLLASLVIEEIEPPEEKRFGFTEIMIMYEDGTRKDISFQDNRVYVEDKIYTFENPDEVNEKLRKIFFDDNDDNLYYEINEIHNIIFSSKYFEGAIIIRQANRDAKVLERKDEKRKVCELLASLVLEETEPTEEELFEATELIIIYEDGKRKDILFQADRIYVENKVYIVDNVDEVNKELREIFFEE